MKTPAVAVILSGCGRGDGSEITETVGIFIALSQAQIPYVCFAPDRIQSDVVNHFNNDISDLPRNILVESARVARGQINALDNLDPSAYLAVVLPGGAGVMKNLCSFITEGNQAVLYPDIKRVLLGFMKNKKPIVALCAAPLLQALVAKAAGLKGVKITLGQHDQHQDMVDAISTWGQTPVDKSIDEACIDVVHRFVSAPAYMYADATSAQVFASCRAAIAGLQLLLQSHQQKS